MGTAVTYVETIPFGDIIEEHIEEVSYLWSLRHTGVYLPNHSIVSLRKLERRIERHLSGLRLEPAESWTFCERALDELGDSGEVFVAAVLAFESQDDYRIDCVLAAVKENPSSIVGLYSSLGWIPEHLAIPWLKKALTSEDESLIGMGLAGCRVRRIDPGKLLDDIFSHVKGPDLLGSPLGSHALALVGEVKRLDLLRWLSASYCEAPEFLHESGVSHVNAAIYAACASAVLLGVDVSQTQMDKFILEKNTHQLDAISISMCALPMPSAREYIGSLAKRRGFEQQTIRAAFAFGDPLINDWLVKQMANPLLARAAARAFVAITGLDLKKNKLDVRAPEGFDSYISSAPDIIEPADDSVSPWPNQTKIAALWQAQKTKFITGKRYFLGVDTDVADFMGAINTGSQDHRRRAAIELAHQHQRQILINVSARVLSHQEMVF